MKSRNVGLVIKHLSSRFILGTASATTLASPDLGVDFYINIVSTD